jgi:glutamate-1-semialdehyde aminotransferase
MGIGTNILGYSNSKVNSFVKKIIDNGSISTLNSNLDFELSKILIGIHPWSDKVIFSRTGAEANAIAIRVARAFSGRDEIAICGYHGWHDWYLSTNLENPKNLNYIHLEGLSTLGIPKRLRGITHPFKYNDINSFKKLLSKNRNIGTVFMEVERNEKPKNNFLKKIREITSKKNIILIFDECTSGFREVYGGLHKKYNVNPDIAVFGKSLGNGIPLTAVIGKKNIMESATNSFISSTFWTDATGPAAGISTLKEMKSLQSWKKISSTGKKIKKFWKYLSKKYKIKISIYGIDAMPSFRFNHKLHLYLRTYLTQEFLKKKILATNSVYCSIYHDRYLKIYFKELDKIFSKISKLVNNKSILNELQYPVSIPGFSRLN